MDVPVSSVDKDLRHPDYIENKIRPLCDDRLACVFRVELLGASHSYGAAGHALSGQERDLLLAPSPDLGRASSFSHCRYLCPCAYDNITSMRIWIRLLPAGLPDAYTGRFPHGA